MRVMYGNRGERGGRRPTMAAFGTTSPYGISQRRPKED